MPERATVQQIIQLGVEATPGTAVPATRRLGSMTIKPKIVVDTTMFRPAGLKYATVQALNKEWAEFDAEGQPTYEEIIVPLNGVATVGTISQVMDGATSTGAYEHLFSPSSSAPDSPKTYTLEHGQAGLQAESFTHALFTDLGLTIKRSGVSLKGNGFARRATTAITPTAGLAVPAALTPILPGQFSVYLDTTAAALGTTRLTRLVTADPKLGGRYNPSWFVDSSQASFTTFVETPADSTAKVVVEADAVGMGLLGNLRAGDTRFLRLEATGPVIYNAGVQLNLPHLFRWDMAIKIEDVDQWSDEDGIYAIPFTFTPVHDPVAGWAHRLLVRNKVPTL